jgi:ATP-binding cassette, subfamily C (CFTR/MRP), member 1
MRVLAGTSYSRGKFAYFAQSPFILNASVRENILFSHVDEPVDEERYQRAIECCALEHDLAMLSAGDQTEIGEKGITLSGGQKARVALARAVYHQADVSLIDDALAAVDAHVATHLFQQCIVGELMQGNGRSVILATNALQHLRHPRVDTIVVLRDGRVIERGSYAELSKNPNTEFSRFLSVIAETGVDHSTLPDMEGNAPSSPVRRQATAKVAEDEAIDVKKPERKDSQLIKEEESAKGNVSADVYFAWSRAAGGVWIPFVVVILYGGVEGVLVLSKWWLTYWSQHSSSNTQYYFLGIYALINLAAMLATFFRVLLLVIFGLRASRKVSTIFDRLDCNCKACLTHSSFSLAFRRASPAHIARSDVFL